MMTFRELHESKNPTFEQLSATLKEYAKSGAAISGQVVVEIIGRLQLTKDQKDQLIRYAGKGVMMQTAFRLSKEAEQYRKVIMALSDRVY